MSRATDGRDRNGCNLKNIHNFFKLVAFCLVEFEQSPSFPNFFTNNSCEGRSREKRDVAPPPQSLLVFSPYLHN